ncbi:MAG: hypothetical protein P1U58_05900 [Verrucomicrobiales bacterium]|nr:hypothetical protein [Verrucomicrobiales bacterium]
MSVAALAAWVWSRGFFVSRSEAMVRLDDRWRLNSRLASALDGGASWPPAVKGDLKASLPSWRGSLVLVPVFVVFLVTAAAWFVPLPAGVPEPSEITSEPRNWDQIDDWLEVLNAEELIEPERLEEIAEQVEELRSRPEEEWFSHSSLEASDTLKDSFGRDINDLARDMAAIERSLDALTRFSTELSEEGREMLMRELSEALESLEGNGLSLNEALAKQLSEIDPSKLGEATMKNLSSEQLQQLQQQLGEGSQTLGSLEGLEPLDEGEMEAISALAMNPGNGGVQRGRSDAPIFYGNPDNLGTNRIDSVSNDDLSRATIGDVIGIGEAEHDSDPVATEVQQGGSIGSAGSGGDAVWKDSLLPDEQAVLKRYFD